MSISTISLPVITNHYASFQNHILAKLNDEWVVIYLTKQDWDYYNVDQPLPQPHLVEMQGLKKLVYIQNINLGEGAFKFIAREPKETLSFANGKELVVYEKRTQSQNGDIGSIVIYWFTFNKKDNRLVSFWTGSCWRSDGHIYPRMIQDLKEKFSTVE